MQRRRYMPFFDGAAQALAGVRLVAGAAVYTATAGPPFAGEREQWTAIVRSNVDGIRIGFVGLGNVGGKLAGSLLRHGMALTVHDLDEERVADFVARGAGRA